jgi:hypothetical protein
VYSFTFNIAGSWGYHEHNNPALTGTITVLDTTTTVQPSGGSGGSGGGGGGGSGVCQPNYDCGIWSECINTKQTRICTDLNNCQPAYKEVSYGCQSATVESTSSTETTVTSTIETQLPELQKLPATILYTSIASIAGLAIILASLAIFRSRRKLGSNVATSASSILKKHVDTAIKQGFSKEAIKQEALKQGWPEDVIEKILS